MYTKIVQIKILYDNECTKYVHQIPTYIQKSTNCTKLLYIQTMYKVHKTCFLYIQNNVQTIQNLYN